MSFANIALWITGLLAQAVLLILLFRRGLFRKVPIFTILLAFYLVRSGLLYGLFPALSPNAYSQLKESLSLADLAMQIVLLIDILVHVLRCLWTDEKNARIRAVVLAVVAIGAAAAAPWTPLHMRIGLDRGLVFTTILALFLAVWMAFSGLRGPKRQIALGFAAYGVIAIAAGFERNSAYLHRDSTAYTAASYIQSGSYLCVVLFWIFTLREIPAPRERRLVRKNRRGSSAR